MRCLFNSAIVIVLIGAMLLAAGGCGQTKTARETPASDDVFAANHRAARLAFERGGYQQAADMYRNALENAYISGDTALIADTRYNLALCLMRLYQYNTALALVGQAREELARDGMKIPPDLLLLEAALLYRMTRVQDSWETTRAILSLEPPPSPPVMQKTVFLRGLIASDRGDTRQLREAVSGMGHSAAGMAKADAEELRGRLSLAEKQWHRAAAHLENAVRLRRENAAPYRMGIALALSAEAYGQAGQPELSALRYLQAGRSAALAGDRSNARLWLTRAAALYERTGDTELAAEARFYLSRIQEQDPPIESDLYLPGRSFK